MKIDNIITCMVTVRLQTSVPVLLLLILCSPLNSKFHEEIPINNGSRITRKVREIIDRR